jgi:hypothetical protein
VLLPEPLTPVTTVPLHENMGEDYRDNRREADRESQDSQGGDWTEISVKPEQQRGSKQPLAKLFSEVAKLFPGMLPTTLLFGRRARWRGDGWRFRAWRLDHLFASFELFSCIEG